MSALVSRDRYQDRVTAVPASPPERGFSNPTYERSYDSFNRSMGHYKGSLEFP